MRHLQEQKKKTIVVIGGGFAGIAFIKRLQTSLPTDCELILISEESYTTFNPMLPEVVGASVFPEHLIAPLRQLLNVSANINFIMGRVEKIDTHSKRITCTSLNGLLEVEYTHVVLAIGNRARIDFLPGMEKFALPLKTIGDAVHIRNEILRRIARIELTHDEELKKVLSHFIVLGGGFSGVEVAGAITDCIHSIKKYYPRVNPASLKVTLVHDGACLLPELDSSLGRSAQRSLESRGVDVLLGLRAVGVLENGVEFNGRTPLLGGTVIATIGTQPNALLSQLGLPTEHGRLSVNDDMSIKDVTGVWAIGDCALVPNQFDQTFSPPTAQFAVQQGKRAADNLLNQLLGKSTSPFSYKSKGSMATVGHMKGVASVFGLKLTGLPAWLLWRAYYLLQMPTFGRKLRIYVEWTWGMFFPADITHFRFQRTTEILKEIQQEKTSNLEKNISL